MDKILYNLVKKDGSLVSSHVTRDAANIALNTYHHYEEGYTVLDIMPEVVNTYAIKKAIIAKLTQQELCLLKTKKGGITL